MNDYELRRLKGYLMLWFIGVFAVFATVLMTAVTWTIFKSAFLQ